jgi:hypothetical protein
MVTGMKNGFLDQSTNRDRQWKGTRMSNSSSRSRGAFQDECFVTKEQLAGMDFVTKDELAVGFSEACNDIGRLLGEQINAKVAHLAEQLQAVRALALGSGCDVKQRTDFCMGIGTSEPGEAAISGLAASKESRSEARRRRRKKNVERHRYHRSQLLACHSSRISGLASHERDVKRAKVKAPHFPFIPERPPGLECFEAAQGSAADGTGDIEWGPFQAAEWCTLPVWTPSYDTSVFLGNLASSCDNFSMGDSDSTAYGQTVADDTASTDGAASSVQAQMQASKSAQRKLADELAKMQVEEETERDTWNKICELVDVYGCRGGDLALREALQHANGHVPSAAEHLLKNSAIFADWDGGASNPKLLLKELV